MSDQPDAPPSRAEILRALRAAHRCLLAVSAEWESVPARFRLRLIRCADAAQDVLRRATVRRARKSRTPPSDGET